MVLCHSQKKDVLTEFSGVTYKHVFTDTKSQYLFYYILPVKPLNIVYKIISVVINNVNITFQVDVIICEMSATEVICTDHAILKTILTAHSDLGVNMGIFICPPPPPPYMSCDHLSSTHRACALTLSMRVDFLTKLMNFYILQIQTLHS